MTEKGKMLGIEPWRGRLNPENEHLLQIIESDVIPPGLYLNTVTKSIFRIVREKGND